MAQKKFVSTKKSDLDTFVRNYRTHPKDEVDLLVDQTTSVLKSMSSFFIKDDSLLTGVGWATLFFHIFRLLPPGELPEGLTRRAFLAFINQVTETRHRVRAIADGRQVAGAIDPDLAQFDSLRQSPNDASALRTRYLILRRHIGEHVLPEPEPSNVD